MISRKNTGFNVEMDSLAVQEVENGIIFSAKIVPGSSSPTKICGLLDGMLKVKVSAPPENGKANQCLIKFLAGQLGIRKKTVSIISGHSNPVKRIKVLGISIDTLLKKMNLE